MRTDGRRYRQDNKSGLSLTCQAITGLQDNPSPPGVHPTPLNFLLRLRTAGEEMEQALRTSKTTKWLSKFKAMLLVLTSRSKPVAPKSLPFRPCLACIAHGACPVLICLLEDKG